MTIGKVLAITTYTYMKGIEMIVHRVEQHLIKQNNRNYKLIDDLCLKSKNLYNYANYTLRQEFITNHNWIRYNNLFQLVKESESYKNIGSNVGQQTLKLLDKCWKSYFKAIKDWAKNKDKYLGKPKLPNYKDKENGRYPLIIDNIKFSIIEGYIRFSWSILKPLNNIFKTNINGKPMEVRFIPKNKAYVMEVVYEVEVPDTNSYNLNIISIDIGIDNLVTIGNNIGLQPFIINGRPLKAMNQYYNKEKAKIQSDLKLKHDKNWSNKLQKLTDKRNNKVNDYIHKTSKYIIDWCIQNNIDTIVIGKNKNWKQKSEMSKKVNQNFVQIPFDILIDKIKYKAENVGIHVIEIEESYTSGTSFLDKELPIKEHYDKSRRIYRGLFKSNEGVIINADLNGAYQIGSKVFPKSFSKILDNGIEGVGLHPIRLNVI